MQFNTRANVAAARLLVSGADVTFEPAAGGPAALKCALPAILDREIVAIDWQTA
jgi:hypothetical protein